MPKEYLGDSVYAEYKDGQLWLTTENGLPSDPSNRIYLEHAVLWDLVRFAEARGVPLPKVGNVDEMIDRLRKAGLSAWDHVEDPEKFIKGD